MSQPEITVTLSSAEAIILFDFLSRFSQHDTLSIEDQAEERVLWDLLCLLEKQLVEPLLPNFAELVFQARDQVRDRE